MQTNIKKLSSPLAWMAGISVIVFSLVGISVFMGWMPSSFGNPGDKATAAKVSVAPTRPAAPHPAVTAKCDDCGVIESTRVVDTPGETSVLGVVGGAVVGGALGSQVGNGRGQDIATVVGAVGGAVAGNEIEKRMKSSRSYETTVRFDDGSTRVFSDATPVQWRVGDRIKVINGKIELHG